VRTHLLVEIHDALVPGVGEMLGHRFSGTHRLERVNARERTGADFPRPSGVLGWVPRRWRIRFLAEHRPPGMYWYYLEPRRPG